MYIYESCHMTCTVVETRRQSFLAKKCKNLFSHPASSYNDEAGDAALLSSILFIRTVAAFYRKSRFFYAGFYCTK